MPKRRPDTLFLDHEARDDAMYFGALVPEARFSGTELPEVLRGPGHQPVHQLYLQSAKLLPVSSELHVHSAFLLLA